MPKRCAILDREVPISVLALPELIVRMPAIRLPHGFERHVRFNVAV